MLLDGLLSERYRPLKLASAALLAAGLGVLYSHIEQTVAIGWPQCVADPRALDGTPLTMPLWTVTRVEPPDYYEVSWIVRDVPVRGPTDGLEPGQIISVVGDFSAEGPVVVERYHLVHRWRRAKVALGALGVILALASAPLGLRIRDGYLEERDTRG